MLRNKNILLNCFDKTQTCQMGFLEYFIHSQMNDFCSMNVVFTTTKIWVKWYLRFFGCSSIQQKQIQKSVWRKTKNGMNLYHAVSIIIANCFCKVKDKIFRKIRTKTNKSSNILCLQKRTDSTLDFKAFKRRLHCDFLMHKVYQINN